MNDVSYHSKTGIESNEDQRSITLKEAFKSYRSYYFLIIPQILFLVVFLPVFYFLLDIFVYLGISLGITFLLGVIAIVQLSTLSRSAANTRDSQIAVTETSLILRFAETTMVTIPLILFLVSICVVAFVVLPGMGIYETKDVITIRVIAVIAVIAIIAGTTYQFSKRWKLHKEAVQKIQQSPEGH
ncbi:MAG: hypothetical protein ACTSQ0_09505 [Candidatus Heimdallarchaeota archaeon]